MMMMVTDPSQFNLTLSFSTNSERGERVVDTMRNLPTIVGLPPDGVVRKNCSKLTRIHLLICAVVLLSLLSLGLLVGLIVQRTKSSSSSSTDKITYCLTDGCLSAASYQIRSMDKNASSNICTDFYSYACGGWQRTHPIQSFDVERTPLGDTINRRDADIEHLLSEPIRRPSAVSWEYKLKTYYTECLDDYSRVQDSSKLMLAVIEDSDTVKGWFLLDNYGTNDSQVTLLRNQSIFEQMAHIHGDLGVLAVFGIRTRFNETNPNIKQLEFYPAGLSLEVNDYVIENNFTETRLAAYQQYIVEIMGLLARDQGVADENLSDRAFTVANDVYTVERFFAESLNQTADNSRLSMMTLEEISEIFSFDFMTLMDHELDDRSVVTNSTQVYINNLRYFTDAFEYLNNDVDPIFARMIHNYFRWRLMWTYMDDLPYEYVHAHRVFLDAYYGYPLHSTNEEYCTREVIRRFPLAVQRLYTRDMNTDPKNIENLVNSLKNGFKQYIDDQAKWIADAETKRLAREKVDELSSAIGYASIASDDTQLDVYYAKFPVSDSSHFQNAFGYHRFHRWTLTNALTNPNALEHWDLFETRTSRLFEYIALFNRLFVINSAIREPLYNSQWPEAMNFGSLGVLLAQKLFASIDLPEGRTHLSNGSRVSSWWSPSTTTAYNTSRQCMNKYYSDEVQRLDYEIGGMTFTVQLQGEPFSPTTLRHIAALRLTYNALMKENSLKDLRMPGTNLTGEQTFFLAYGQTQCYQRQTLTQYFRTQLGIYDERTALNAAVIQMPEFAEAFQCVKKENICF